MPTQEASNRPPFLTAEWRHLAMLNFEVPRSLLAPHLPKGTELDSWNGKFMVSVVGFRFLNTRIKGIPIPLHRNFDEVNLRFYVRRRAADGWRRGVVFIRELVPRTAIALVARVLYEEPYLAVPMSHRIECADGLPRIVEYRWRFRGRDNRLKVEGRGGWRPLDAGGEAEFITEHYWGYTKRSGGGTSEYQVAHSPWRIMDVTDLEFDCDVAALYGDGFREFLTERPRSALLAEGSSVTVYQGGMLLP
jgi:uncharacterized protein